jgi:hypothetical protein
MPQLSKVIWLFCIQCIFEIDIALVYQTIELRLVLDSRKLEGLAWVENGGMLGKVPIGRIIETVLALSDPIDDKQTMC